MAKQSGGKPQIDEDFMKEIISFHPYRLTDGFLSFHVESSKAGMTSFCKACFLSCFFVFIHSIKTACFLCRQFAFPME